MTIPAGKTILVVDDAVDTVQMFTTYLQIEGCKTIAAYNGQEAVDQAIAYRPDLILMDVSMPIMDGYEAARRIRSIPELAKTTIVAVSAHSGASWKQRALEAGCVEYVFKPIDPNRLLELVERYS